MSASAASEIDPRELARAFEGGTGVAPRLGVALAAFTTYAIGGPAAFLIEPDSEAALARCLSYLSACGLPYKVLGGGSNLLVSDAGVHGWVIKLGRSFRYVRELEEEGSYEVGAATALMSLSRDLSKQGWSGLEFAGGIPASLGGAVRMNAGAHGGQMADIVQDVSVVTEDGERLVIALAELGYSYRRSQLPKGSVVTGARLKLTSGRAEEVLARRSEHLAARKAAQPLSAPSAGSVFKNPPGESAGLLIERAGLKGTKRGGAEISDKHGNWIVNPGKSARAEEVRELIEICRSEVGERFGIELEQEVIWWE